MEKKEECDQPPFLDALVVVENHKSPEERPSLAMLSKTTIPGKLESKQSSKM